MAGLEAATIFFFFDTDGDLAALAPLTAREKNVVEKKGKKKERSKDRKHPCGPMDSESLGVYEQNRRYYDV